MRKIIFPKPENKLQHDYPIKGKTPGWFFRCREQSNGVYLAEGIDVYGRQVSHTGTDPEQLLSQCDDSALMVNEKIRS
jgi:hypothetical protein